MLNVNKILNISEIFLNVFLQRWWRLVALKVLQVGYDASSILYCMKMLLCIFFCMRCRCVECDQL